MSRSSAGTHLAFAAPFLLAGATAAAACTGPTSGGAAAGGACSLADECTGAADCCPPITGRRVDRGRGCARREGENIACVQQPAAEDGGCIQNTAVGCYVAKDDPARVYITPSTHAALAGFEPCDAALEQEALAAARRDCP